ncbi:hypothetical protein MTR67_007460, partial [Solanum verrucosum]
NQQNVNWPWKTIWKVNIPYKVSCFIWLLSKEAVLTQDNLMKKGIILSEMRFLRRTSRNCSAFVPSLQNHMSALEAIHKP